MAWKRKTKTGHGGRSHGVDLASSILGTADGDLATEDGDPGGADEPKSPHDITGTRD